MVFDTRKNIHTYAALGSSVAKAIRFLQNTNFDALPDGRIDIDGERVYATVMYYETRKPEQVLAEAHHRYLDLQCMLEGTERVELGFVNELDITVPYDAENDILFYAGKTRPLTFCAGECLLLFPQDAHAVGLALEECAHARKVVVKIQICEQEQLTQ